MAQTVKNLPAMQETWDQSLGREDPLEKGMATHSCILTVHGVTKSWTQLTLRLSVTPYLRGIHPKTPSGYLRPGIIPTPYAL